MKNVQSFLARSWEKVAFWGMALLFVLALILWVTGFGHERVAGTATHPAPQQRHYLNPATAFAFSEELPPLNIKNSSPFLFAVRPPHQRGPPPPRDPPVDPPPFKKVDVGPPPKAPVTRRMIEYLGTMTTASGRSVALLLDRNSGQTSVVQAGAMFSKYKIKSFSPKEAVAEDAKGAEVVFPLGTQTGIPLE